jgi:hypothetical protein
MEDHGDGYEPPAFKVNLIPQQRSLAPVDESQEYRPPIHRARESYRSDGGGSSVYSPERPYSPRNLHRTPTSSSVPLAFDPYGYQPDVPEPIERSERRHLDPDSAFTGGVPILPSWRRHLISWILAVVGTCVFIFTIIFAWNATGGQNADTRLLFSDPGRTILVLQVLGTVTTSLLAELVVASCEMVAP